MWQHEPCLYGWAKGKQPERKPPLGNGVSTVWPIDQKGEQDGIHPTQKPVEILLGGSDLRAAAAERLEARLAWARVPLDRPREPTSRPVRAAQHRRGRPPSRDVAPGWADVRHVSLQRTPCHSR